ncbi:DUF3322 and DUF2220 domain-containing protein [Thermomonas brevis]
MILRRPDDLLKRLRTAWSRNRSAWLAGQGQWPLRLPLGLPTEQQAEANWPLFDAWLREWASVQGGHVQRASRRWSRLGEQHLPSHWCFESPADVAEALQERMRWQRAAARHAQWCKRFDADGRHAAWAGALASSFEVLADTQEADFARLGEVLAWLLSHPASGLYLRQLPIAGIDSKWMEPRRGTLAVWLQALGRSGEGSDFNALAGLRSAPPRLRLRVLDARLRAQIGGLGDVLAPLSDIAALPLRPSRVLIVENRDTGMALNELPDTVAVMALGYSVDVLAAIPWLATARIGYWGDIDTHGLSIFSRLRGYLPQAQALMMDTDTLQRFQLLAVREPRPQRVPPMNLPPQQHALWQELAEHHYGTDARLEQERLPWDWAWDRVLAWTGES